MLALSFKLPGRHIHTHTNIEQIHLILPYVSVLSYKTTLFCKYLKTFLALNIESRLRLRLGSYGKFKYICICVCPRRYSENNKVIFMCLDSQNISRQFEIFYYLKYRFSIFVL